MMKWLKQKTSIKSKDSASNSNSLELGQLIKSSPVTKLVTLKDINSLMKTALVCLFVISCGQQSGIEKHGEDYYHTKKVKFDNKGELPKIIKEEPRYVPVKDKGTEEVIEIEPVSEDRIELIEDTQKEIEVPKTPKAKTETDERAKWAELNIKSIHKKIGKKYFFFSPLLTLTINLKNDKSIDFKADIDESLSYENITAYKSRGVFLLNNKETLATIYCMDESCEESNIELTDSKTNTHYATIMSGTELKSTNAVNGETSKEVQLKYTDIVTKETLSTIAIVEREKEEDSTKDSEETNKPSEDIKTSTEQDVETNNDLDSNDTHDHSHNNDKDEDLTPEDFETKTETVTGPTMTRNQFIWPVSFDAFYITSFMGKRHGKNHHGIDLGRPKGYTKKIPIKSIADGIVTFSGVMNGFGNTVIIKYIDKLNSKIAYEATFAHMDKKSFLKKGDTVSEGFVIGYMGSTGRSTGVHLHLELKNLLTKIKVNPLELLQFTRDAKCSPSLGSNCNSKYLENKKVNPNLSSSDLTS